MLRLPLICGFRRLAAGPIRFSGTWSLRNAPLSVRPLASWTKLGQTIDKSSPMATEKSGDLDCSSTTQWPKERPDEGAVMVHASACIGGEEKQGPEDKTTKADNASRWENRLPGLKAVPKTFDVQEKEEKDAGKQMYNPFEGDPTAWQLGEDVDHFLARCAPSQTNTAVGPWIWIANPHAKRRRGEGFDASEALLKDLLSKAQQELAKIMSDKSLNTKSKKVEINQHAESLKQTILAVGAATDLTAGKWMLFPKATFVDIAWSKVARATNAGDLGISAKVATNNGSGDAPVICVYTYDFADVEDIKRVLLRLEELGFCNGRTISYKPDIYTHIGLNTGNEYQITPSIYSSKDFLRRE